MILFEEFVHKLLIEASKISEQSSFIIIVPLAKLDLRRWFSSEQCKK
jgi:hypothetical protein